MKTASAAPSVRTLLAGLFAVVAVLPLLAIGGARVADNQLVRQTEEALITESVVVGEVYRALVDPNARAVLSLPPDGEPYAPFVPSLDLRTAAVLAPAERGPTVRSSTRSAPLTSLLGRVLIRNLSGLRVLDTSGVVVASATGTVGYSLAHLEEVQAALRGEYVPSIRARSGPERDAPLSSISRTTSIRVSVAVPIYRDPFAPAGGGGDIIGVVYDSRTPIDLMKYLWLFKGELALPLIASAVVVLLVVLALGAVLGGPLRRLQRAATRVASGAPDVSLAIDGLAPREVHALADAVERMRGELEARTEYVQRFAADTAHELKTPLTSLRGAAELLLDGIEDMPAEQRDRFLSNVHDDAVRMDGLVQRILQLARIEAAAPIREQLALDEVARGVAERFRQRGHDVEVDVRASTIDADPGQLEALLGNLLDNAVRHGAGHPVTLRVTDDARIEVIDRGPTAPPDGVFERFYTTERASGGTGLGLAIVQAVARAHGGRAWAERRGQETVFGVELRPEVRG